MYFLQVLWFERHVCMRTRWVMLIIN